MACGTIHAVDENLFLLEGEWPNRLTPAMPGSAVFRAGPRLYLLDTGAGSRLRSGVQAVAASFGRSAEVALINSGRHPGLTGNNDLLEGLAAGVHRHLRPPVAHQPVDRTTVTAAYPAARPTSVPGQDLCAADAVPLLIGGATWTAWWIGDGLAAVEATARSGRLGFYLRDQRTFLLPDELALAPAWPGSDVSDVLRVGALVLTMIEHRAIEVLSLGFGAPLDPRSARLTIENLMERARSSRSARGYPTLRE